MRNRVTKLAAALAAIAALAAGGATLASGAGKGHPPVPAPPARAQQGGQATGEMPGEHGDNGTMPESADTDNVQQGDQTTADTEGNQATESSSDGPAGYADTSPNANTQQEGEH